MTTPSATLYRSAAAEGATYIGSLLLVYDGIANDLRRAAEALTRNDIAGRCNASNHALLLLGHLESWAKSMEDPALETSLLQFYSYLRAQTLTLQNNAEPEQFHELARLVSETRAAWQQKEAASQNTIAVDVLTVPPPRHTDAEDRPRLSWSA